MSDRKFVLEVEDLGVSFDGFKAVDGFNFYLSQNSVHVIIGPNGAGKTTVLDLICGKTRATAGSIRFKNKELRGTREYRIVRLGIGRKFQNPSIYENLTVMENLEISHPSGRGVFGCLFFRRTPEILKACKDVAEQIGLSEKMDTEVGILSHGQKQWLEIGMLLMQNPEIIMLDEPVAGMSVKERQETSQLIRKISQNRSVIVIEHDMEFVKEIADRVTVMHMGKVISEGSMETVQNDPKVIEVYIGH
ncbi:MAG: urea ABC transporter ATP-binding protein UrtD [Verrucomicrobium sp.]|nr:urea ABC transporter ATP-binding protein UrtD [Verrucomicrobium sp.]